VVASRTIGRLRARSHARRASSPHPVVTSRRILGYAAPLLVIDAAFRIYSSIDVLLIAAIIGGGAPVAAFSLPLRLTMLLEYPASAVAAAIAPRAARWQSSGNGLDLFARSLRYLVVLQMLLTAPLVVWSDAIVRLIFGDKYPEAPAVLQALAPYVFLMGIAQLVTLAVNYLGEARRRVPIALAMLAVNVVIDVVLLPQIGIVAGAIGTSAAFALWVPAHLWILRQRAGLQLRPLAITTVRTCVAGAVMVAALAALGTGHVQPPLMAAGLLIGPAAYIATLFAVRELTLRDVADLRSLVSRRTSA
jgi:O-antigen/teichoic acid export membrane protein